jgi:hypothetical protein
MFAFAIGFIVGFCSASMLAVMYLVYHYFLEDNEVYRFNQKERTKIP